MKLFIDTANVNEIREIANWGVVDGVTTNPSLIAKEKRDFKEVVTEITGIVDGPISAEVVSLKHDEMVEEAKELGLNDADLRNLMDESKKQLNEIMPAYYKLADIEIMEEEFVKTPKRSIKRYLYK